MGKRADGEYKRVTYLWHSMKIMEVKNVRV